MRFYKHRTPQEWKKIREKQVEKLGLRKDIQSNPVKAILNSKAEDKDIRDLCSNVLKGEHKGKERFVFITKKEIESILLPVGFKKRVWESYCLENVYDLPIKNKDNLFVSVFSTVDKTNISRNKGKDSIKVLLTYIKDGKFKMLTKGKRLLRVEGWQGRLKLKVNEVYKSTKEMRVCNVCGAYLVERKIKNGDRKGQSFFGCCMYPSCYGPKKEYPKKEKKVFVDKPIDIERIW